jgi:hypothetical protein
MAMCVTEVVAVVPMPFTWGEPDGVAGTDFLFGFAFALHPAEARRDDQSLAEWMGMPDGAGTGLEGHGSAGHPTGRFRLEGHIDAHRAGKPLGGSLSGGL